MSTQMRENFVPVTRPAQWVKGLLIAKLVLSSVSIVVAILQTEILSMTARSGSTYVEEIANESSAQRILIIQFLMGWLEIWTIVVFLIWFFRAHKNLSALGGRELKYSPGWAVGGFFVPFLSLVRPLQVMREVWHGSDPSGLERDLGPAGPSIRNYLNTPSLVGWWWSLFLITAIIAGFILHRVSQMQYSPIHTIFEMKILNYLIILSDLCEIPYVLVTITLINRITRWQVQRAERIRHIGSQAQLDTSFD